MRPATPLLQRLAGDRRGQIYIEYLALFVLFGVAFVLTVGPEVGARIALEYERRLLLLYAPYP